MFIQMEAHCNMFTRNMSNMSSYIAPPFKIALVFHSRGNAAHSALLLHMHECDEHGFYSALHRHGQQLEAST
jgi:hypothetical protein